MIRVVLDTNVLVSALLKPQSTPALVLDAILSNEDVELLASESILREYALVLRRDKFAFPKPLIAGLMAQLRDIAKKGSITPQPEVLVDENDQPFWDLATSNRAYLITGNTRHFSASELVRTPHAFVEFMRS